MIEVIVALLVTGCMTSGVLLRYAPFKSIVSPAKKKILFAISAAASALNFLVILSLLYRLGLSVTFDYLIFCGPVYAIALSVVKIFMIPGRTREHLFLLGIVLSCHFLLMSVPAFISASLSQMQLKYSTVLALLVYSALLIIAQLLLKRLLCSAIEPFLEKDSKDYWKFVWFIPIVFFAAVLVIVDPDRQANSFRQLISSIFSGSMMVLICVSVASSHSRFHEWELMGRQLDAQKIHYAELKIRVEEARKTKHDFKHHVAAIRHYMDMDDKEGLRRYCDDLMATRNSEVQIPYTGNVAADGVLYHYLQKAWENGIRFQYGGVIRNPGISDMDISVLLGNALDNAFTGTLTLQENRSIQVVCQTEQQSLSILVHNSFDGNVKQTEEGIMSRKREQGPGIGLSSMQQICDRYGGILNTKWDDQFFTVTIVLPLKDEN